MSAKHRSQPKYQRDGDSRTSGPGFGLTIHPDTLEIPLRWRRPRLVFVNSMSDLFHPDVPETFIGSVWNTMALTPQHTYQILTKRPQRMAAVLKKWAADDWIWRRHDLMWCGPIAGPLPNVWLGTSVENQRYADLRIPHLLATPAAVRFLSCEPLLGPVDLGRVAIPRGFVEINGGRLPRIDWVIAGGESGAEARPTDADWFRLLRDQCQAAGVPFFFKQWGGRTPKAGGKELDGREWCQMPERAA